MHTRCVFVYHFVGKYKLTLLYCRSYQVRGHLAAKIDPIGLNNMDADKV